MKKHAKKELSEPERVAFRAKLGEFFDRLKIPESDNGFTAFLPLPQSHECKEKINKIHGANESDYYALTLWKNKLFPEKTYYSGDYILDELCLSPPQVKEFQKLCHDTAALIGAILEHAPPKRIRQRTDDLAAQLQCGVCAGDVLAGQIARTIAASIERAKNTALGKGI